MDFKELVPLGLGGAAIAILFTFELSYILLVICSLFLIHASTKLWIEKRTDHLEIQNCINTSTFTESNETEIRNPCIVNRLSKDETVDSDFEENLLGHLVKPDVNKEQHCSEKTKLMSKETYRRDEYDNDVGNVISEVITDKDEDETVKNELISVELTVNDIDRTNDKEKSIGSSVDIAGQNFESGKLLLQKEDVTDMYDTSVGNSKSKVTTEKIEPTDKDVKIKLKSGETTNNDMDKEKEKSKFATLKNTGPMCSFLERIGLEQYYPDKLELMDAMKIRVKKATIKLEEIPFIFVNNIVMINNKCRDQMLYDLLEQIKTNNKVGKDEQMSKKFSLKSILEGENEFEINPLDLLLALIKCSSPMLKLILANKLFMCKLAIPFILPNLEKEPLEMSLWPLRSVIVESKQKSGSCQYISVDSPCEVVSFVRIGRPSVSKSKLINELITDPYHNTFSNMDCPLGASKRLISDGIVEATWYIKSQKSSLFKNMTMLLNLRGNGSTYIQQLNEVSELSDILVVMLVLNDLEEKRFKSFLLEILASKKCVVLALDARKHQTEDVEKKLQCFMETTTYYEHNMKPCILSMAGQMRSISLIKTEIKKAISGMMRDDVKETLYSKLSRCKIRIDEEAIIHRHTKLKALKVLKHIPDDYLDLKESVVPLQGEAWASWSQKLKTIYKSPEYKVLQQKGKIEREMIEERQKQMIKCKNLGPFMKQFLEKLSESIHSNIDCTVFVLWLKHFLDQKSRSIIPGYLSQYQCDWKALKKAKDDKEEGVVIKKCREKVEKSEHKLAEASFGFEHICREMGQIFESIQQCKKEDPDLVELANKLPLFAAKFLLMGIPFEIMDGDVANVPLLWVRAVFEQLKEMLGEKKLLALSVLGIQSSGKSTLLNTMFGLQFAVSAGRCTRGVFIQLIPVDVDAFKFDYVLVIDTEGLKAPELVNQKHSHDNELATFVIGLGDITVVNIKGENTAEIKDVLQIAVHAFLRLKLANENLNLKQSCLFVHQNVPAIDAKNKMMQGRQKVVEILDEMTREAAEQENIADIHSFKQVIDFDSEKNVWYFSDLWHGNPPMAPVNPGYSENVSEVKEDILIRITSARDTYLTITHTINRIEDLWNGILRDDFVFNFRNSLELKAYNSMDQQFQTIIWTLEKFVLEFIKSEAKSKLVNCENEDALENAVPTIMIQLAKDVDKGVTGLNNELDSFVENSTLKDIMIQWMQAKRNRLSIHADCLIVKAKIDINNTKEELRIQKLRWSEKTKHEKEINDKAKELAIQMKGELPDESILNEKFNCLWNSWINKFASKVFGDVIPIDIQIKELCFEMFRQDATYIKDGKIDEHRKLPDVHFYQNISHLSGTLTVNDISRTKHLSIHRVLKLLWQESKSKKCKEQAIDFANKIFRKIDVKLAAINTDGIRFDPSYVKEILHIVSWEISEFNQHTNNDYKFNLLPPFRAMVVYHVVQYATVFFERLHDNYNKRNSPKAQMEEYKGTAWELFKNTVENKTEDVIAFGFFRDAIVKVVVDQISECLPIDVQENIRIRFTNGKYSLIKEILIYLATSENFEKYKPFIQDPYTFSQKWITELLNRKLFQEKQENQCLYTKLANSRVSRIFLHISKCISDATDDCINSKPNCISEWVDAFVTHNSKSPDLPLSNEALVHVRDRKISDLEAFTNLLKDELAAIERKVMTSFTNPDYNAVQWRTNPVPDVMDKLWGCSKNCMFCQEPCINTDKDHLEDKFLHKCLQHRPIGVGGFRWTATNKLCVDFCNHLVSTDTTYSHGTKSGKYKNYRENYPNWDIPPNSDVSKYWMWVICKYTDELKEMYDIDYPDIPESWWLISREDAINSL